MATVNFLYRSTKDKAPLNLRLLYRYNDKDFVIGAKTHYAVEKIYWRKQHKQRRPKDIAVANKQAEVNQELNKIENHVLKAFNDVDPLIVNKDWLQLQVEQYYNPPREGKKVPTTLVQYIDFYIEDRNHEIKPASVTKFKVIKHKMERFEVKRKRPILIKDVNENFKREFVEYYQSENYSINTTQRELGLIKTFCKHARSLDVETHPQLDKLRLEKEKVNKIYLSFKEQEQIAKLNDLSEHLENARDWLIISCYTGQRISDFMRFNNQMIRIEKGKHLLEFTQTKTGKIMTVPLHKKVLEILEKRNGRFPRAISDQRYNEYIKEVCKEAKITEKIEGSRQVEVSPKSGVYRKKRGTYDKWKLVTSHIGRRSFATNYYGKIPTSYLIYITGHSTEAMFLQYIGKSNKDLAMEISNYF